MDEKQPETRYWIDETPTAKYTAQEIANEKQAHPYRDPSRSENLKDPTNPRVLKQNGSL